MSGFRVDIGSPADAPWGHVVNVRNGEALAVECSRCKQTEFFYVVTLRKAPGAIAEAVDIHAMCIEGA